MILITEIPFQVNKALVLEKIGELIRDKTIEGISDLRDRSDRNGMRIVIEIKRDIQADVVFNQLWRHTRLQTSFSCKYACFRQRTAQTNGLDRDITSIYKF